MEKIQPYSEIEAEREKYPLGQPRPYVSGHKNYLAPDCPPYRPNRIPLKDRIACFFMSVLLLVYGAYGLAADDIWIPVKRTVSGIHFHGNAAVVAFVAICCTTAPLVAIVVDHYDKRNNEALYKKFIKVSFCIGLALHVIAIFLQKS